MRLPVRLLLLAAFVALCPRRGGAQQGEAPESRRNISPAIGLHYGSPMRFSLAVGALIDLKGRRDDGIIVVAEPGLQGNAAAVGYFRMLGRFGSGYSVRAAALRTRDKPWNASANTTYAGLEGQWMIAFGVGVRVGYLRRVSRSVPDVQENLATVGISLGM